MLRIIEVLRLFVSDETGFVKQQNSLALPWTASIMIAAAVMFGGPTASEADDSWSWHDHGWCPEHYACVNIGCSLHFTHFLTRVGPQVRVRVVLLGVCTYAQKPERGPGWKIRTI